MVFNPSKHTSVLIGSQLKQRGARHATNKDQAGIYNCLRPVFSDSTFCRLPPE